MKKHSVVKRYYMHILNYLKDLKKSFEKEFKNYLLRKLLADFLGADTQSALSLYKKRLPRILLGGYILVSYLFPVGLIVSFCIIYPLIEVMIFLCSTVIELIQGY
jgi:hypothetical protein